MPNPHEPVPVVPVGPMGWGIDESIAVKHYIEQQALDKLASDCPICYRTRPAKEFVPTMLAKFNELQASKGYGADSFDMTLLDEFLFGKRFTWRFQDIGSCVLSNTFRGAVRNFMAEIALRGDPEEFFGRDEFGPKTIAFFVPASYGWMRKRGGLTGRGDGGFCQPCIETFMKDGLVMASTPKLLELLGPNYPANHFPEPIGNPSLYRAIGDGKYLNELLPYTTCRMLNSEPITSVEKHRETCKKFNTMIQCSGIAIKKIGTHPDGFDIHARDTGNSWAHNMGHHGYFTASDGQRFYRHSNESWAKGLIYNIPENELDSWYTKRLVETMSLGDFDQSKSVPVIN